MDMQSPAYSDDFQSAVAEYVTGDPMDRGEAVQMELITKLGYAHSFFDFMGRYVDLAGKRFIEVGCGTGYVSAAAAERGANVTVTDFVPRALKLAQDRLTQHDVMGRSFRGDLREVHEIHKGAYDFVWCFQVLEHIPREGQFKALRNLLEMVARNGYLFIDTENNLCPYDRHDSKTWLIRLLKPEVQSALIGSLGKGLDFYEPSAGQAVQMHDYLSYDEIIGAAKVFGFEVVNPFMPHEDGRQYMRQTTGSDWLHDNLLKHVAFERFSPVSVLLKRA